MSTPVAVAETEQELIAAAQQAMSQCNWTVGECAAKWTQRFARGRTDADFGALVGLSGDQVYQRRRVWETFADVRNDYPGLKWSHFYVALTWPDAGECLGWASENAATVAEMKAWRRMQHGEDLTAADPAAEPGLEVMDPGFGEPLLRLAPGTFGAADGTSDSLLESQASAGRVDVVSGASQAGDPGAGYAPFRKDAGSPPPRETVVESRPVTLDPEQAFQRITAALERCNRLLTDGILDGFADLDEKLRLRFLTAVENLNERVAGLS